MISADILLKGLGGVAVVGGAAGMGVCYHHKLWIFAEGENLKSMGEKVGLDCTGTSGQTEETGIECNIKNDGLSVKQNDTAKETGKKKGDATAGTTAGKIKGYKVGNGFKFVIEEGDIALKEGSASNITKLEQFETYEIEEDGGDKKQYLTRKKKSWEEKRRFLGIPEEEGCAFPESGTAAKECPLDKEKIKKVKFDGITGEPTVKEPVGTPALSLKISITPTTTEETTQFPLGYKFELQSNKEITLGDSKANKSIKKDTNTEFKIKKTGSGKNISLSLEKAWTVKSLGDKVGLGCPDSVTSGAAGECSLTASKVNVKNDANNKFENHSNKDDQGDKKVKVEVDQEGYNQGFKFYAETEICLKDSANANGENKKIEAKGSDTNNQITYQILKDTDGKWYLTKKTTTPAAG